MAIPLAGHGTCREGQERIECMSQAFIPTVQSASALMSAFHPARLDTASENSTFEGLTNGRPFVAASPAMLSIQAQVERMARFDLPVLVQGEVGTGKTAVARLLHQLSIASTRRGAR